MRRTNWRAESRPGSEVPTEKYRGTLLAQPDGLRETGHTSRPLSCIQPLKGNRHVRFEFRRHREHGQAEEESVAHAKCHRPRRPPRRGRVGIVPVLGLFPVPAATNAWKLGRKSEDHELMDIQEADTLLGSRPTVRAAISRRRSDLRDEDIHLARTVRSYTLTAFYTKDDEPSPASLRDRGWKYVPNRIMSCQNLRPAAQSHGGRSEKAKAAAESSKPATTTAPAKRRSRPLSRQSQRPARPPRKEQSRPPRHKSQRLHDSAPAKAAEPASASPKPATAGTRRLPADADPK